MLSFPLRSDYDSYRREESRSRFNARGAMTTETTIKLSRIYEALLRNLEDLGKFDLWGGERQQALQLIADVGDEVTAVERERCAKIAERPRIQDAMVGDVYTDVNGSEIAAEIRR